MRFVKLAAVTLFGCGVLISGCQNSVFKAEPPVAPAMSSVPAVRLNFRFEPDVPAPDAPGGNIVEERNAAVQADFDAARPLELLDQTLTSPDKKRVLAIYHRISDILTEYRLDMYTPDGKLLRKMTSDTMAVHFPETIVWSPDSASLAFVAMIRAGQLDGTGSLSVTTNSNSQIPLSSNSNSASTDVNSEPAEPAATAAAPTPAAPTGILTYRTEQIYTANADGSAVKALTENEGLIYFYYAWSPDSTMLVALATTAREWKYLDVIAGSNGETMTPQGRPRIIEKNGRERRLDDNQTTVKPVWSPDSSKVAAAFDTQIRIYDAAGTNPTQAAIPLRNQLLLSSQAYDRNQQRQMETSSSPADANTADAAIATATPTPDDQPSTLPDEKLLVSYNPIVELAWPSDDLLYLQTAYLKRMKNEADSVRSFSRWHRLPLTTQITSTPVR